ncbi:unnamed protein product [Mytilus edulis]|uniref:IgGFc-binding protein N-terminal domain-containing protein n=1 Tax=Mytilus edulis TaxID=6550 RepID=A0A8S3U0Q1_MYTED|nr:unnamed protein product [Mytilus edulis]
MLLTDIFLMFSPNIYTAHLLFATSTNGVCNLHKLGTSSGEKITLHDKSAIKILKTSNVKQFKLHCNVSVKLFVLTQRHGSSMDSYIALPKRYIGTDYLIPSYTQSTTTGPGTYLGIVSSKPKSQVEIFGKDKRSKLYRKITMDKEKSWQDYNNDRIDISGTYVKATTPVAVFSNIVCVQHDNSCYPFSDMVIPMRDYSKVFLIPHIENTEKWTIRLYAKLTCNVKIFDNNRRQLSTYTVKSDKKFIEMHFKSNVISRVIMCINGTAVWTQNWKERILHGTCS